MLDRLRAARHDQVVAIGRMPPGRLDFWPDQTTDDVVIIGSRRAHYLRRHPELATCEDVLVAAVVDPDEIHANAADPRIAILYWRLDIGHHVRIALWVSDRKERQNSVLSARIASDSEVVAGRAKGRMRWKSDRSAGLPPPA